MLSEDARVIQVLRPLLPELGIHTDQCASVESASELFKTKKYEAIIVDAEAPGELPPLKEVFL